MKTFPKILLNPDLMYKLKIFKNQKSSGNRHVTEHQKIIPTLKDTVKNDTIAPILYLLFSPTYKISAM